jgi:isopenicillin-N epimerase
MHLDRRSFLIKAGVTAAAAVSVSSHTAGTRAGASAEPDIWKYVRGQFDQLAPDRIHLSSFFLVSHPRPVREAIENHRRAIDDNPLEYLEKNLYDMPGKIQAAAAEYLGGKPEEIALTNSTTMGLALIYQGLPLKSGQEILTTAHDHFVHHESIRLAAERAGASVKKIALYNRTSAVTETEIAERVRKGITPKTRAVGMTWVHSGTGLKLPIRQISDVIREANRGRAEEDRILLIVDGVHGFGVEDESVPEMGADFFIAGTHKWIFGPRGTGIVWARAENWKELRMVFPAFAAETFGAWMTESKLSAPMRAAWVGQGGFHAFEYEWALPAAFEFHRKIGRKKIAGRIHFLNEQCRDGLATMRHIKLHTPRSTALSAGLVCFEVDGIKSADVVKRLHEKSIVASTAPYREGYARLAPSLLNSPEEIDTVLREIKALA